MGTSEFSVPNLQTLIFSKHTIIGVYTKSPKYSGRGMELQKTKIHQIAESNGLSVFCPSTLRTEEAVSDIIALNPDIIIVSSYGLILPANILEIPRYGCINVHPSDLPRWRGAAPIQRTIMAGDKKGAVCIIKMDSGLDTGDIILKKGVIFDQRSSYAELSLEMSNLGSELLLSSLELLENGNVILQKQSIDGVKYAEKISKEEELINWDDDVLHIHNKIRALSPRPGAYFKYNGELIKIIISSYKNGICGYTPGTVIDNNFSIACGNGVLIPELLQRQGKKMLYRDAFLRGFPIANGKVLE